MKVHWTPEARAQLHAIQDYIARESPKAAREVVEGLTIHAGQLVDLPRMGKPVSDYGRDDLRQLSLHPYLLIYRLTAQQIDIVSVMHMRRLLPREWQRLGNPKA